MQKFIRIIIIGVMLLNTSSLFVDAKETKKKPVRVKVRISANDDVANRMQKYIKEEFRKYGNVVLVNSSEQLELAIVASKVPMRGGVSQDFAFSILILKPSNGKNVSAVFYSGETNIPPSNFSSQLYVIQDQLLKVGYPNLQSGCESIVKEFANKYLMQE